MTDNLSHCRELEAQRTRRTQCAYRGHMFTCLASRIFYTSCTECYSFVTKGELLEWNGEGDKGKKNGISI